MDTILLGFAWTFLALQTVSMIHKKIPSPSVSWSYHYCSRNNRESFTPPIHRAMLALSPRDFRGKQPETLERDVVSRASVFMAESFNNILSWAFWWKKDLLVFNLRWITIPTLCAMTENYVFNSKVDSVKQMAPLLINIYFLPCI